jgi:hypothetical protein
MSKCQAYDALNDEVKALMRKAIVESMKDGREREFKVCCNEEEGPRLTSIYTGKETQMRYSPKCRKDEKVIIHFHTHPCKECWDMSVDDIYLLIEENADLGCVGSTDKDGKPMMSCFWIEGRDINREEAMKFLKELHISQKIYKEL